MAFKGLDGMRIPSAENRMTKPEKTDTIQLRHSVKKLLDRYCFEEERKTVDVATEIISDWLNQHYAKIERLQNKR